MAFGNQPDSERTKAGIKLTELLDRVWDFELEASPLLATNVGDPRGQDRLANDSLSAIKPIGHSLNIQNFTFEPYVGIFVRVFPFAGRRLDTLL